MGLNSKKRACSTNSNIFDVHYKKNQHKKFFVENLHAVCYKQPLIRCTSFVSFALLSQISSGRRYIVRSATRYAVLRFAIFLIVI